MVEGHLQPFQGLGNNVLHKHNRAATCSANNTPHELCEGVEDPYMATFMYCFFFSKKKKD